MPEKKIKVKYISGPSKGYETYYVKSIVDRLSAKEPKLIEILSEGGGSEEDSSPKRPRKVKTMDDKPEKE